MTDSVRQAVLLIRELRGGLKLGTLAPAEIANRLDRIEAILDVSSAVLQSHDGDRAEEERALRAIWNAGGAISPLGLGQALDPRLQTPAAGLRGGWYLERFRRAGFVTRSGHGRWTLTDRGAAKAHALRGPADAETLPPGFPVSSRPRCRTDLGPTIRALARHGGVATSGDIGRALDPDLSAERACSLGGNRLRQVEREGFATRNPAGGWSITPAGEAEATRLSGEASR